MTNPHLVLLALLPWSLLLAWAARRLRRWPLAVVAMGGVASMMTWALLSWVEWYVATWIDPAEAFASVEYLMRDVSYGWLWRHIVWTYGWVLGLAHFIACWAWGWFGYWPQSRRGQAEASSVSR